MKRKSPNYGLDAPGAVRGLLFAGLAAVIIGFLFARWATHANARSLLGFAFAIENTGIACLTGAALMLVSSYFGKFRVRDSLIRNLRLRGDETILDVGCGHGLLLINAARRLPHGRAVGIDLWSQVDQSNNSREAALENAALEGVTERVEVRDGDMRELPFADSTFDAAVAHFAIHNVPGREGRRQTIREIVRVLKPGGQVALSDLKSVGLYAGELRKLGMQSVRISWPIFWTWPPSRIVTARKPVAAS